MAPPNYQQVGATIKGVVSTDLDATSVTDRLRVLGHAEAG
jgi:hypothetical protein